MLPVIEGTIARRVLLNFRADPAAVQHLLPEPLKVQAHSGHAIVGVCLIRFEHLRPRGMHPRFGLSTENMAQRVAVLYPSDSGYLPGVYIWRRETNSPFISCLGGKVFPGVHRRARFDVHDNVEELAMNVITIDGSADVAFRAQTAEWQSTSSFATLDEASNFFCQGSCGYSTSSDGRSLEGLQLRTANWSVRPLQAQISRVSFFEKQLPKGSFHFDCALIMRNVAHSWHELESLTSQTAHFG